MDQTRQRQSVRRGWTLLVWLVAAVVLASGCETILGADFRGFRIVDRDASVESNGSLTTPSSPGEPETGEPETGEPTSPGTDLDAAVSPPGMLMEPGAGDACVAMTCQELNFECGAVLDNCGNDIECGQCAPTETCQRGRCIDCVPVTCEQRGAECGSPSNLCGELLNCGACPKEPVELNCGADGVVNKCGEGPCVRRTCSQLREDPELQIECGLFVRCGGLEPGDEIDCGGCPLGKECRENKCVCKPLTCEEVSGGGACGPTPDGCGGEIVCGCAGEGEVCHEGVCCAPRTKCPTGLCSDPNGPIDDGCGGTIDNCECAAGEVCENGSCCNFNSPEAGRCPSNQCNTSITVCGIQVDCTCEAAGEGACCNTENQCQVPTCPTDGSCGDNLVDGCGSRISDCGCPDGQTCVRENGNAAGTCQCAPRTCADFDGCGTFRDGCGGELDCTDVCGDGEVCHDGACCTPSCPAGDPRFCGRQSDGCGGRIDCSCDGTGPLVCDDDQRCCLPQIPNDNSCGMVPDGCGGEEQKACEGARDECDLSLGDDPNSGECVCIPDECPTNFCGTMPDGCGDVITCTCERGSCVDNECTCPRPECPADGTCGAETNECGTTFCGCPSGQRCDDDEDGQCVCDAAACPNPGDVCDGDGECCSPITACEPGTCGTRHPDGCGGFIPVSACGCEDTESCSANGRGVCECDDDACADERPGGVCHDGACCTPETCRDNQCGTIDNQCGGTLNCGGCSQAGEACINNLCQCSNAECPDGETCQGGACTCDDNACDGGRVCQGGECVCPEPTCLAGQCGVAVNACGRTENCGGCAADETCTESACLCDAIDCDGFCGALSNGCSTVNCGGCPAGQTCGDDNTCACQPITECSNAQVCGSIDDGCGGSVACGTCPAGQTCGNNNTCACQPITECSNAQVCGSIDDGCGGSVACGTCPAGQSCDDNACVADPLCEPATCPTDGTCGDVDDGCGGILDCGCPDGQRCNPGQGQCMSAGGSGRPF